MVTLESVEKQLKKLKFNMHAWGRSEAKELPNILLEDEEIYEVVNGYYEAGFALLVATDVRVLLVDKKPLNYLTVEDFRFDMINEIDYSHRLIGAHVSLSAGNKNLDFTSFNQQRLRKLISHVQHCIAESKKKQSNHAEDQKLHLEQINQQLQAYLLAQHKHQEELREQLAKQYEQNNKSADAADAALKIPEPVKLDPALSDYLFAQSLLAQSKGQQTSEDEARISNETTKLLDKAKAAETLSAPAMPAAHKPAAAEPQKLLPPIGEDRVEQASSEMADLYAEGMQEIFGRQDRTHAGASVGSSAGAAVHHGIKSLEVNPLKVAYSKLPMALRNRRFGRPSFHDHSQANLRTDRPLTES